MSASDSFVGDGLRPSPYQEAVAEVERLREALREIAWSNNTHWQHDRARAALREDGNG